LNDVVQRVTALEGTSDPNLPHGTSTDKSIELISEATEALGAIAERADDAAVRRLETDLDVLKDRLDALR